ncbi:putative thiamine biosynthesis protein ApbE precursor [Buchnera aphidicola str. Bp (Baizongia pistaciae)]|uniref:FAD:protein FMN transferase n=1 Tax=Buchnera aphidicola subsp. Baizongia pistaciae (strain Bp) TaxID=224915 RepID=APBE_BUCBP|nr:FAD:protein FMN transferase [Buchnera aphidicola]Q89AP6.1 RecName: Full=FAD:protein FMN transferase; AltName: Full=Flavin transferase; Flags: Precursor [Buchnera aphidicola str. Bp (Baizongia pistaciae)]AAO26941.1 putative thiamine biosynthesis protein ApbE precursor [Buchnera aphidicola str. Bp (Baizongia pistaciae)]
MAYVINICILYFLIISIQINKVQKKYETVFLCGYTMGTTWKVKIINNRHLTYYNLKKKIEKQLCYDNNQISSWNKNSDISNFNKNFTTKPQKINKNLAKLISIGLLVGKKTNNLLDITSGTLINIWGFGPTSRKHSIPSKKTIKLAQMLTGLNHIKLLINKQQYYLQKDIPKLQINLSTLGEGFAADNLKRILDDEGINDYYISIGGTVVTHTSPKNSQNKIIAIQKPTETDNEIHCLISLKNNAVSTSGTYRNYYTLHKKIIHIINPITGNPANTDLVSVTVISKSALKSDAWDTGLILLGFRQAKKISIQEKLAVCLIKKNKSTLFTWTSPQFKKFLIK